MHHSFDIFMAQEYGIQEAILIHHFQHWIRINKQNKSNFYDGKTWTYQRLKDISDQFIYMSIKQVERILNNLVKKGVILKGNYNINKYDRTCWYAFVDENRFLPHFRDKSRNAEMENSKRGNENPETRNCIITDTKPDTKPNPTPPTPSKGVAVVSSDFNKETIEQMLQLCLSIEQINKLTKSFDEKTILHAIKYCQNVQPNKDLMSQFIFACREKPDLPVHTIREMRIKENIAYSKTLTKKEVVIYELAKKELDIICPGIGTLTTKITHVDFDMYPDSFRHQVESTTENYLKAYKREKKRIDDFKKARKRSLNESGSTILK